jgi:hypothetical protein
MLVAGLQLQVAGGPSGDQVSVVIVIVVAASVLVARVVGVTSQRINVQPKQ